MKLTVLGCGDAFGSGGRLQTSYHLDTGETCMLLDCGATALIGLERAGLDAGRLDGVIVSHLHGDHFSGLVWWFLHAVHVVKRRRTFVIAGPAGIEARFRAAAEVLFPGSLEKQPFELRFVEQRGGETAKLGSLAVTPFEVSHPSGAPSHALRIETGGKVLAFSGDTEWVEALVPCAQGADLFLCECYAYHAVVRYHMTWARLSQELPRISAHRVVLTHMSAAMLSRSSEVRRSGVELAEDGMVLDL